MRGHSRVAIDGWPFKEEGNPIGKCETGFWTQPGFGSPKNGPVRILLPHRRANKMRLRIARRRNIGYAVLPKPTASFGCKPGRALKAIGISWKAQGNSREALGKPMGETTGSWEAHGSSGEPLSRPWRAPENSVKLQPKPWKSAPNLEEAMRSLVSVLTIFQPACKMKRSCCNGRLPQAPQNRLVGFGTIFGGIDKLMGVRAEMSGAIGIICGRPYHVVWDTLRKVTETLRSFCEAHGPYRNAPETS